MIVSFSGYSDDIVHVDFSDGRKTKEYYPNLEEDYFVVGGQLKVIPVYNGCWAFAPALLDEGVAPPSWPICINYDPNINEYTLILSIYCPAGTTVVKASD